MTKFTQIKNRNGVTLIELIVTLAIFTIVISAVMNLFVYNNKIFNKSVDLSQVQFDVRMASDHITTELRNKNAISTTENTLSNSIDVYTLQQKYPTVNEVNFNIKKVGSKYFVAYTISGSDGSNNNYSIDASVMLNNIISTAENSGVVIYYE